MPAFPEGASQKGAAAAAITHREDCRQADAQVAPLIVELRRQGLSLIHTLDDGVRFRRAGLQDRSNFLAGNRTEPASVCIRAIAAELTARGIKTRQEYRVWHTRQVARVLARAEQLRRPHGSDAGSESAPRSRLEGKSSILSDPMRLVRGKGGVSDVPMSPPGLRVLLERGHNGQNAAPQRSGVLEREWLKMAENGRRKRDDTLMLALASGQTIRDAARAAGISERTATRRMAETDFRRRVEKLRGDMVGRALGKMADGMADAADKLRQLLAAKNENVQLGACRALLELAVKLREIVELEQRLAALEELAKERKDQR